MYLRILIKMDNVAFGSDGYEAGAEVARILRNYAERLSSQDISFDQSLMDANGNTVGGAVLIDGDSCLFEADKTIGDTLGEMS